MVVQIFSISIFRRIIWQILKTFMVNMQQVYARVCFVHSQTSYFIHIVVEILYDESY